MNLAGWLDRFGSCGSLLCSAHCLLCALAPGLLAAASPMLLSHEAEWLFVAVAAGTAAVAAVIGFRLHRSWRIVLAFAVAGLGLVASRGMEELGWGVLGTSTGVLAGLGLAATHLYSARACNCIRCVGNEQEDAASERAAITV